MKKMKLKLLALAVSAFFAAGAQNPANQKSGAPVVNAQRGASAGTGISAQQNGDTTGAKSGNTTQQSVLNKAPAPEGSAGNSNAASSTPAIPQVTESMSGSPAILAADDGRKRDGTNSVQRASMNMAGSPVRNINLGEKNVNPNTEIKRGTRAAEKKNPSAQDQNHGTKTATAAGGANQSKKLTNTRRENQDASDQSNAAKKKKSKEKRAGKKG
jgi:hypothetical protein